MYVVCMYVVFCKIDHCIRIHWCIVMGLGHSDPWVESHMWPQQTWGERSSRGQWPLVQVFGKKGQCIHILWCIFKSNITMIAKVCDRKSRRDSWFENRLVFCCFFNIFWFMSWKDVRITDYSKNTAQPLRWQDFALALALHQILLQPWFQIQKGPELPISWWTSLPLIVSFPKNLWSWNYIITFSFVLSYEHSYPTKS